MALREIVVGNALVMAEGTADRKLFFLVILLSIPMFILCVESLLIFSEAGSGSRLEKRFYKESKTELFTTISTELQTPRTRLALDGSIYSFANLDSISKWQTSIIYERHFPIINISMSGHFLDDRNNSVDVMDAAFQLYKQRESQNNFSEYGLRSRGNSYLENDAFSNLEFNTYYIYKRFLRSYTIHHELNSVTKHFANLNPLLNTNYQIIFSFPANDYSGFNISYFINYNIINNDDLLYFNEELFDLFAYNLHKFSIEYTMVRGNLLFKPWLAVTNKEYLTIAVEQPYSETSFLTGFYADWLLADGFMTYTEGLYQTIAGTIQIAYKFMIGIKFQFDIK